MVFLSSAGGFGLRIINWIYFLCDWRIGWSNLVILKIQVKTWILLGAWVRTNMIRIWPRAWFINGIVIDRRYGFSREDIGECSSKRYEDSFKGKIERDEVFFWNKTRKWVVILWFRTRPKKPNSSTTLFRSFLTRLYLSNVKTYLAFGQNTIKSWLVSFFWDLLETYRKFLLFATMARLKCIKFEDRSKVNKSQR